VNDQNREGALAVGLPVAMAEDARAGLNLHEAGFRGWQGDASGKKEAAEGLKMAAVQAAARVED